MASNNGRYDIELINEELEIYRVRKKNNGDYYDLQKNSDGNFSHFPKCKALEVYGDKYLCRHKKMVLGKFFAAPEYKYLFNLSPRRNKSIDKNNGAGSDAG